MSDFELQFRGRRDSEMRAFAKAERLGLTLHAPIPLVSTGVWSRVRAWRDYFRREGSEHRGKLERPAYAD